MSAAQKDNHAWPSGSDTLTNSVAATEQEERMTAGNFITGGLLSSSRPSIYLSVSFFCREINYTLEGVCGEGAGGIDRVFSLGCEEVYFVHSQKYSVHAEFKVLCRLKGQCHEIFCFWFFSSISFPPSPEYPIRTVSIFFENSRRYSQLNIDHRCR